MDIPAEPPAKTPPEAPKKSIDDVLEELANKLTLEGKPTDRSSTDTCMAKLHALLTKGKPSYLAPLISPSSNPSRTLKGAATRPVACPRPEEVLPQGDANLLPDGRRERLPVPRPVPRDPPRNLLRAAGIRQPAFGQLARTAQGEQAAEAHLHRHPDDVQPVQRRGAERLVRRERVRFR